jgi:hypothetical protein
MEKLEKVELVREKCNVSYEEARDALEACNYDVLDAIVMLEQAHGVTERMPADVPPAPDAAYELPEGKTAAAEHTTSRAAGAWKRFCARCKELWTAGLDMTFVAERNGEQLFTLPVLAVVIGLLIWGASLWLLIIGLFLGLRYRIEGKGKVAETVNDAMDKAADAADSVKESIA